MLSRRLLYSQACASALLAITNALVLLNSDCDALSTCRSFFEEPRPSDESKTRRGNCHSAYFELSSSYTSWNIRLSV
ncbi:hypothetical protein BDV93DRAFT_208659 [Ceratobasidium sp. AG-I]|nr:hypothetical protein BDV93DRAFT_208659 [Ceratobasidium sp. AG-I]